MRLSQLSLSVLLLSASSLVAAAPVNTLINCVATHR